MRNKTRNPIIKSVRKLTVLMRTDFIQFLNGSIYAWRDNEMREGFEERRWPRANLTRLYKSPGDQGLVIKSDAPALIPRVSFWFWLRALTITTGM